MMDVALPANMHQGLSQEGIARRGWAYSAEEAKAVIGKSEVALIDLREKRERERYGKIPGGLHLPYHDLQENVSSNGVLSTLAATGKILLFYCAFGERSTMAVQAAQDAGLTSAPHIEGGIDAWKKVDGVLDDGSGSPVHDPAVGT